MKRYGIFILIGILMFSIGCSEKVKYEVVTFTTSDNITIYGSLFKARGDKSPAIILSPQIDRIRGVYYPLAEQIAAAGITALCIDMRNQGETLENDKEKRGMQPQYLANSKLDIQAAIEYLSKRSDIDPAKLAILGADFNANQAILAAGTNKNIKMLFLFSGGYSQEAKGLVKSEKYRVITSFTAFSEGEVSLQSKEIVDLSENPDSSVEIYMQSGHGSDMLWSNHKPEIEKLIVDKLVKHLK